MDGKEKDEQITKISITNWRSFRYMGETPAHECVEHIVAAGRDVMRILLGIHPERAREESIRHAGQAIAWLADAHLDNLSHDACWSVALRLDPYITQMEDWRLAHGGDHSATIEAIKNDLDNVRGGFYSDREHYLRLYGQGLLSYLELRPELHMLDAEEELEGPAEWRTPAELRTHLLSFIDHVSGLMLTT